MDDTPNKMRLPPERWKPRFVAALAKWGVVTHACKYAGVSKPTAYQHKKDDPEFSADWDDALQAAADMLEKEAYRRACHGVEKGVYQQGKLIAMEKEYSDQLLMFLLKGLKPEKFRERYEQKVSLESQDIKVKLDGVYES